jgi:hypothetical protein
MLGTRCQRKDTPVPKSGQGHGRLSTGRGNGPGSAQAMIDDGLFKKFPKPDVVLGQHVMSLPAGVLAWHACVVTSASDRRERTRMSFRTKPSSSWTFDEGLRRACWPPSPVTSTQRRPHQAPSILSGTRLRHLVRRRHRRAHICHGKGSRLTFRDPDQSQPALCPGHPPRLGTGVEAMVVGAQAWLSQH